MVGRGISAFSVSVPPGIQGRTPQVISRNPFGSVSAASVMLRGVGGVRQGIRLSRTSVVSVCGLMLADPALSVSMSGRVAVSSDDDSVSMIEVA